MALDFRLAADATLAELDRCVDIVAALRPDDFDRWTKLPGWRVRDLVWHVARGPARNAEVLRRGDELPAESDWGVPHPVAHAVAPPADEMLRILRDGGELLGTALEDVSDPTEVLSGRPMDGGGLTIQSWATNYLVEFGVHRDDLERAIHDSAAMEGAVLDAIFDHGVEMAIAHATADRLQPVKPRGYRFVGDSRRCAFHWDGTWGGRCPLDTDVAVVEADDATIARLIVGRVSVGESPQKLTGDWVLALDLPRWCGVW